VSPRPLRQFYGGDRRLVIEGLGSAVEPFRRHRTRFLAALAGLADDEWAGTTRCDAWDAKDVCNHLASADGFFAHTLGGRGRAEPTTFLRGFDPTSSPEAVIAPQRAQPNAAALASLTASTARLDDALAAGDDDEWPLLSESPFGHVPLRVIAAHSLWDSWLHERDILGPLGRTSALEDDEVLTAAAFTLFVGGAQGGVLDDDQPVGAGPDEPIDVTIAFTDLPGRAVRLRVDREVEVSVTDDPGDAVGAGSAVEFVEAVTGRAPAEPVLARLPVDLAAQLGRARQVL
jgi:uncharacterized protein (TIGR03083 family)